MDPQSMNPPVRIKRMTCQRKKHALLVLLVLVEELVAEALEVK